MCARIYEYWIKDVLSAYFTKIPYNLTTKHQQEKLFYFAWREIMQRCFQSKQTPSGNAITSVQRSPLSSERSQNLGSSRNTFQIDHLHNLEVPIIKDKMTGFSVNGTYDTNTWKHQIFIQKQRLRVIAVSLNYPAKGGTEWLSDASWSFTNI